MFDFAWSELALIALVALVVIGPKDLPRVMRLVGVWTRKARGIAREFQGSLDDMLREADLLEVKQQVERAARFNFQDAFTKTVDPDGSLHRSLTDPLLTNPLADVPKPVEAPPPVESLPDFDSTIATELLPGTEAVAAATREAAPSGPTPVMFAELPPGEFTPGDFPPEPIMPERMMAERILPEKVLAERILAPEEKREPLPTPTPSNAAGPPDPKP